MLGYRKSGVGCDRSPPRPTALFVDDGRLRKPTRSTRWPSFFANIGSSGGVATYGGDPEYSSVRINHESTGTYRVTWDKLAVVPAVVTTAQHGSDASYVATPGYVTNESMYVYTRDNNGNLVDEEFSFVIYF